MDQLGPPHARLHARFRLMQQYNEKCHIVAPFRSFATRPRLGSSAVSVLAPRIASSRRAMRRCLAMALGATVTLACERWCSVDTCREVNCADCESCNRPRCAMWCRRESCSETNCLGCQMCISPPARPPPAPYPPNQFIANPFLKGAWYKTQHFRVNVLATMDRVPAGSYHVHALLSKIHDLLPTAFWLDKKSKLSLAADILQDASSLPVPSLATFVMYNREHSNMHRMPMQSHASFTYRPTCLQFPTVIVRRNPRRVRSAAPIQMTEAAI